MSLRASFCLLAFLAVELSPTRAWAKPPPHYHLASLVSQSEVIVRGIPQNQSNSNRGRVTEFRIRKGYAGPGRVDDVIGVNTSGFSLDLLSGARSGAGISEVVPVLARPNGSSGDHKTAEWQIVASGLLPIVGGKVHQVVQYCSPGCPYQLGGGWEALDRDRR